MIRIAVAEDERLLREAIVALLNLEQDFTVVAEADSGNHAIDFFSQVRPDVALLDLEMPGLDGVQVAEILSAEAQPVRCVIVTRHARPGVLRRALKAGVVGFVSKSVPIETLGHVIRRVSHGGRYVDPELAVSAISSENHPLTDRELEVLRRVGPSTSTTAIGLDMSLSPGTVRNYLSSAMQKIGAHSRAEAVATARDYGWI